MVRQVVDTVTVLYPGSMGSAVARRLSAIGCRVFSYVEGRSPRTRAAAADSGVLTLASLEEAVAAAELVVSLVPQDAVVETAAAFAEAARTTGNHPLYLDGNSVAPSVMVNVRALVEQAGAECVDGSFIGNDKMLGDGTTLYLSGGSGAQIVAASVAKAFRTRVISTEVGVASAFKLSIWGFNKGLVALFLDMMAAADYIGQRDELLQCLRDFYPGTVATVERLLPTYPRHAKRRVEEMGELESWLAEIGQDPALVTGAKTVLSRFNDLGLQADGPWDFEQLLEVCCRRGFLSLSKG